MNKQNGFTLLELIVAVALIIILSMLIIVSVESHIDKGKDSAVKTNLISIALAGSSWELVHDDFSGFCQSKSVLDSISAISKIESSAVCKTDANETEWCACASLVSNTSQVFCIDSSPAQKTISGSCASSCIAGACTGN